MQKEKQINPPTMTNDNMAGHISKRLTLNEKTIEQVGSALRGCVFN